MPKTSFPAFVGELPLEPYPYRWVGAEFLARSGRALLADEMGLGKTVQAILAAAALRRAREPVRRTRGRLKRGGKNWRGDSNS